MSLVHRLTSSDWQRRRHRVDARLSGVDAILAYSMSSQHYDLLSSRELCEDRKGVLDHLYPNRLIKSSLRVVIMQGTQVATNYLNDQLKEDMHRDELVHDGKLTRREADKEADTWAEREWNQRWADFPHRLTVAFAKYHSIILVMRFYEYLADKMVDKWTLDKLTMDTFDAAKRSAKEGKEGRELARDVFHTSWKANFISYLADYSVHQVILAYGYYVYVKQQRKRRHKEVEPASEPDLHGGALALSFTKNSTLLALSRVIGLLFSSIGGGMGAMLIAPGWGSLVGANLGDGLAMAVADDFVNLKVPVS